MQWLILFFFFFMYKTPGRRKAGQCWRESPIKPEKEQHKDNLKATERERELNNSGPRKQRGL